MKPLFSLITCSLNTEKYIRRCIISVKAQKYHNYEHILIDGESTDDTLKIIKDFKRKRKTKIRVYSIPAKGISNAFNYGIERARGKYLYFLNSDDSLYDEKVLTDAATFLGKNQEIDWIYGKIRVVEDNLNILGTFPDWKVFQKKNNNLLKYVNYIPHQAAFVQRKVFNKFGKFDESLKVNMDVEFWLRIFRKTEYKFFDRIIADYTIRSDSATSSKEKRLRNIKYLELVQKRYLGNTEMILARVVNRFVDRINKT